MDEGGQPSDSSKDYSIMGEEEANYPPFLLLQ